jgi:hypothetical protein
VQTQRRQFSDWPASISNEKVWDAFLLVVAHIFGKPHLTPSAALHCAAIGSDAFGEGWTTDGQVSGDFFKALYSQVEGIRSHHRLQRDCVSNLVR